MAQLSQSFQQYRSVRNSDLSGLKATKQQRSSDRNSNGDGSEEGHHLAILPEMLQS